MICLAPSRAVAELGGVRHCSPYQTWMPLSRFPAGKIHMETYCSSTPSTSVPSSLAAGMPPVSLPITSAAFPSSRPPRARVYPVPSASSRRSLIHPAGSRLRLLREQVTCRQQHYSQFAGPLLQHFVVVGHDIYHEVLAVSFTDVIIPAAEFIDERLLVLRRSA